MTLTPGHYRPTVLKWADKHCPRAVDFYEQGAPYDRRIFAVGTAAHAVLQAVGEETDRRGEVLDLEECERIAWKVCRRLITKGRTFDGDPEPPMPADAVWAGKDAALKYLEFSPLEAALGREVGLAVDHNWKPVPYSKKARLRLILDVRGLGEEATEEAFLRVLEVKDYKTAWPTDATELDTVQLKAQAVVSWIHAEADDGPPVDIIRQTVVNVRTCTPYVRELAPGNPPDRKLLERWKREITLTMEALDDMRARDGSRPARPDGGCVGCPFIQQCVDGQDYIERAVGLGTPQERARGLMVARAAYDHLLPLVRQDSAEMPVEVDGYEVGTLARVKTKVRDGGAQAAAATWMARGGLLPGWVEKVSPSPSALEAVAKHLNPETPGIAAEMFARWTEPYKERRFGWQKIETNKEGEQQ